MSPPLPPTGHGSFPGKIASEAVLDALFHEAPHGLLLADADGRLVTVNQRASTMTGHAADFLIGRTLSELAVPEDQTEGPLRFDSLPVGGTIESGWYLRHRDGRLIPILGQVRRLADGHLLVTWREPAPTAAGRSADLQQELERMRFLSENLADGMVYQINSGRDGRSRDFTYLSPAVRRFHHLTVEEVLLDPSRLYSQVAPEFRALVAEREAQATAAWTPVDVEVVVELPTGERRWRRFVSAPRRQPDGCIVWDGIELDITPRKLAEEESGKQRAELLAVQHLARISSYRLDLATDAVSWSPEFFEIVERHPDSFPHTSAAFLEFVHPDDRERLRQAIAAAATGAPPDRVEYRVLTPDGRVKHIASNGRVEFAADGRTPVGLTGYSQDISDLVRAEVERDRLRAQLAQARKLESVGRLAGGVAHDFNNMLAVILGRVELLLQQVGPDSPHARNIGQIQAAAQRSADLTRQLLAFARRQTVSPKVLSLNAAIEAMVEMIRRLIGEEVELVWIPGPDLWPVRFDPAQLHQVLTNLCVNARDAIAGVGRVVIRTGNLTLDRGFCEGQLGFSPGDYVLLSVSDDGQGMDEETLEHVFEPFFTTKEIHRGTGLGLPTVFGIVQQNDGQITVSSRPGEGSCFRVFLPRVKGQPDEVEATTREAPPPGRGEVVLVVEDEPSVLDLTRAMLESLGYRVVAARTPGEALAVVAARESPFHLLLTDVVMPERNGRELEEQIRAICPDLKVLFMSGYTADIIAHRGVLDEGRQFIQKPFSLHTLAVRVRTALEQPHAQRPASGYLPPRAPAEKRSDTVTPSRRSDQ